MQTHHDNIPEPPPFGTPTGLMADEHDIDLGDPDAEQLLDRHTVPEGVEYLGDFPTVEAYCRAMLEPEIAKGCAWILDHLDMKAVIKRFEGNDRLVAESGCIYKVGVNL